MFCENCGAKISDDSIFCENCGAKINNFEEQEEIYVNQETYKPEEPVVTQETYKPEELVVTHETYSQEETFASQESYEPEEAFASQESYEQQEFVESQEEVDMQPISYEDKDLTLEKNLNEEQVVVSNIQKESKLSKFKNNKKLLIICICVACAFFGIIATVIIININSKNPVEKGYELYLELSAESLNISVDELEDLDLIKKVECVYKDDYYCYKVVYNYSGGETYFIYNKEDDEIDASYAKSTYTSFYTLYKSGDSDVKYKKVV